MTLLFHPDVFCDPCAWALVHVDARLHARGMEEA
jgi:hypothetical protein